jgi:hypothetical protein
MAYLRVAGLALPAVCVRVLLTNLAEFFLLAASATDVDLRLTAGLTVAAVEAVGLLLDRMKALTAG